MYMAIYIGLLKYQKYKDADFDFSLLSLWLYRDSN